MRPVSESHSQTYSYPEVSKSSETPPVQQSHQSSRLGTQKPGLVESLWASLSVALPPPASRGAHLEEWGHPDHLSLHPGTFIISYVTIKRKGPRDTSTIWPPKNMLFWFFSISLTFKTRLLRRNQGLNGGNFLHSWPPPMQLLAGSLRMVISHKLPACVLMLVCQESRGGSES